MAESGITCLPLSVGAGEQLSTGATDLRIRTPVKVRRKQRSRPRLLDRNLDALGDETANVMNSRRARRVPMYIHLKII